MPQCPVCSGCNFATLVNAHSIQEECELRGEFIERRLSHPVSPDQLKDLTDFFHQSKAEIAICSQCSLLLRRELEPPMAKTYTEEEYAPEATEAVYPQYLAAFRGKEQPYRSLLPANACVVEIGSHYGAFLQTAQEWGWHIEGVDIGTDTSRFALSKGFVVHTKELPQCEIPGHSQDGVFIWNCFEQIADPRDTLQEAHRVLKPGGLLVVRTPNGLFYSLCHQLFATGDLQPAAKDLLTKAMAYNNLLGFPYLYGHSRSTLNRLIESFGFKFEDGLNSELITLPLPDAPGWVEHQEEAINKEVRLLARSILADTDGVLTGPWIEVWHRRSAD